jgi:hypothetical protein
VKRHIITIAVVSGLMIIFFICGSIPLNAVDYGAVKIREGFTLDTNSRGQIIQKGSEIHQLENGITEVYDPNGVLVIRVLDSDCENILTPGGKKISANHIISIPEGCLIIRNKNGYDIMQGNNKILKVIDSKIAKINSLPGYGGYVEQSNDWSVASLTHFSADFIVPLGPPNSNEPEVEYYWNGLQSRLGQGLLQPVLEWNYGNTHAWTGSAWYYINDNDYLRRPPITVNPSNSCQGIMDYDQNTNTFHISFINQTTGQQSVLAVQGFSYLNLAALIAYEGHFVDEMINNDNNAPRDCEFYNLATSNFGSSVNINWTPLIDNSAPLSGLAVIGANQGSTDITLRTTYTPALSVTTNTPTNIASNAGKLNGSLNGLGSANGVSVSFEYGPSTSYGMHTTPQTLSYTGSFNSVLSLLNANTTYHYRAKVVGNGTIYGNDQQFTTLPFIALPNAIDNTSLTVETNGDSEWFGQTTVCYFGGTAAQSGYILDSQTSRMQTIINGPASANFYWKISSESNCDWLSFYVDGNLQDRISGTVDWTQKSVAINGVGTHILKWEYTKDGSVAVGSDTGWVDKLLISTPPGVSTNASNNIGATTATLNGNLDNKGTASTVNCSFVWGTTQGGPYPAETSPATQKTTTGTYSFNLTGLSPYTTYFYKAKAVGDGTAYGSEQQFTTQTVLTVNSAGGGTIQQPGAGTYAYNPGSVVSLTAASNTGYAFVNWTGSTGTIANVNSANTTITMNGNYAIQSNFKPSVTLYSGWNYYSTPFTPTNTDPSNVFSALGNNILSCWYYNQGSWYSWTPPPGPPGSITGIADGFGYQINMQTTSLQQVIGSFPTSFPSSRYTIYGPYIWNQVGMTALQDMTCSQYFGDVYPYIQSLQTIVNGQYVSIDFRNNATIHPGQGFWMMIYTNNMGLNPGSGMNMLRSNSPASSPLNTGGWSADVSLTSPSGFTTTARIGTSANATAVDDMPAPPIPPSPGSAQIYISRPENTNAAFRILNQNYVKPDKTMEWPLAVWSIDDKQPGKLTINWDKKEISLIPEEFSLWLTNGEGKKLVDMRSATSYQFPIQAKSDTKETLTNFKILAELK